MDSKCIGLIALATLLASACGSDEAPSFNHYQDEMTDGVTSVQTALTQHHQQVLSGSDLHQIGVLEQRHLQFMTTAMGQVQDANDSIEVCSAQMNMAGHMRGGYTSMQTAHQGMADTVHEASGELERHVQAMRSAPNLDAARSEERHYTATMDPLVQHMQLRDQDMVEAMQQMHDDGYSMTCPVGSHMHHGS